MPTGSAACGFRALRPLAGLRSAEAADDGRLSVPGMAREDIRNNAFCCELVDGLPDELWNWLRQLVKRVQREFVSHTL